ncbi:MAG TPA: DUF1127 domain-containing protein [Acetobacteraceae bacterium]|nr:DUF1127 domain-containing protein [Acetobacteraceae bacterium]
MSVQTSKQAVAFKLPEMLSYHSTWDDADYEPVFPRRRPGWAERLASFRRALSEALRHRAVQHELSSMSDRELADIGINRYDIGRIFDPEFAREYEARGE